MWAASTSALTDSRQGDMVIIQLALSKDQIDEVISLSRTVKRRAESK
jgi:hypothetical protein